MSQLAQDPIEDQIQLWGKIRKFLLKLTKEDVNCKVPLKCYATIDVISNNIKYMLLYDNSQFVMYYLTINNKQ